MATEDPTAYPARIGTLSPGGFRHASNSFRNKLREDSPQLLELLEVTTLDDQEPMFRFVNYPTPIKWPNGSDGNVYQPLGYSRDPIKQNSTDVIDSVNLLINDVSADFLRMFRVRPLYDSELTIKWISREIMDDPRAHSVIFVGRIHGFVSSDTTMGLAVESLFSSHDTLVPRRVFQEKCTHRHGDPWCGIDLTLPEHNHYGIVMGGSDRWYFDDNSIPYNPLEGVALVGEQQEKKGNDYWKAGSIRFITGENAGVSCGVRRIRFFNKDATSSVTRFNTRIFLKTPLPFVPKQGDRFHLRRGCLHIRNDCRTRYNNLLFFGGNPDQPRTVQIAN